MSDPTNVKLGICAVTFNSVDLGYTKGGVEVEIATEAKNVTVDQFGNSPINSIVTGRTCKVKVPLAETTLANLVAVIPGASLITDGTDSMKKKVEVPSGVGTSLLDYAKKLVLHPTANGTDKGDDFTVPLAMTPGTVSFAYKLEDERIYSVEFTAFADPANDGQLFIVGDESAVAA